MGELKRAEQHLDFCVELYREQAKAGRYFVHEHLAYDRSWQTDIIESVVKHVGVVKATCDQCIHGCADDAGLLVKKPASFIADAPELRES